MIGNIKILIHQGKQYIPDVTKAELPGVFRGRPVITNEKVDVNALTELCPTAAISPLSFLPSRSAMAKHGGEGISHPAGSRGDAR